MANELKLTRAQLASFLKDPQQIKQFERLFSVASGLESTSTDPNPLELAIKSPANTPNNSVSTDYIDLNKNAPHTEKKARLHWDEPNQTASIGMDYGVTQQIGMETYARVQNLTGATITKGSPVGFVGAGTNNTLQVSNYLADGTLSSLYILGVMSHDLPDSGEVGYCTVWGHVNGIDTTGVSVSETWSVGDILYCHPTQAGKLTNVKPTAPNNVIPIAAVLQVDATNGEIFVRPTIEQQEYYGVFTKTTDQAAAAINTAYDITFDNTQIANGISIGSPTSRIVVAQSGLYRFDATIQLTSTSASAKTFWAWFRKNGVNIDNSSRLISVDINGGYTTLALSRVISLAANDYVTLAFAVNDITLSVDFFAATAFAPASPSVILNVTQVQQ